LFTAVGAFMAGALIPSGGVGAAFIAAAIVFVLAAGLGLLVRPSAAAKSHQTVYRLSFRQAMRAASRLVFDVAELRILVFAAVACEVLGFSFQTAIPALARDVLAAGAEGLGTLNASTQ